MNHQASELRVSSAQLTLINSNVPGLSLNFAAVRQLPQTQPVSSGSTLLRMCVGRGGCLMASVLSLISADQCPNEIGTPAVAR